MANLLNNPSLDPADNNSLAGSIRFAFSKLMQRTDGMLPAKIISYDSVANRAEVQLLISLVTTSGVSVPRALVASMPVAIFGGGGFLLNFPIAPDDLGWVIANDRDISNFLSTYAVSIPNTNRVKSFSDGVFIPNIMRDYTLASDAAGAVVLQNLSGTVSVAVSDTDVTINAANNVTITAATDVILNATTVTVNASHNLNVNASANMLVTLNSGAGILGVNGSIRATGTVTPSTTIPPPLP